MYQTKFRGENVKVWFYYTNNGVGSKRRHESHCVFQSLDTGLVLGCGKSKYNPNDAKLHMPCKRIIGRGIAFSRALKSIPDLTRAEHKDMCKVYDQHCKKVTKTVKPEIAIVEATING